MSVRLTENFLTGGAQERRGVHKWYNSFNFLFVLVFFSFLFISFRLLSFPCISFHFLAFSCMTKCENQNENRSNISFLSVRPAHPRGAGAQGRGNFVLGGGGAWQFCSTGKFFSLLLIDLVFPHFFFVLFSFLFSFPFISIHLLSFLAFSCMMKCRPKSK